VSVTLGLPISQVYVIMIDTGEFTKPLRGEVRNGIVRRRRWMVAARGRIVEVIAEVARRHDPALRPFPSASENVFKSAVARRALAAKITV
jgi:hypothetical protein